jgi:uncharacterized protein YegP (UPF0339 family)
MRIKLQHAVPDATSYGSSAERFYFEIQADGNWETLTTSEVYNDKDSALSTINAFADAGLEFEFVDETA